jgi:superfamily I DNA/RNA helicase
MNKFWVGPPGTGKTHTLIEQVKKFIAEGIHPNEIAYISFTNVAADEAKKRAIEAFPEFANSPKAFENFRTLHSLAYAECPEVRNNTMETSDYVALSKILPFSIDVNMSHWESPFDNSGQLLNKKNAYLFLVNKAVCCKQSIEEAFNRQADPRLRRNIAVLLDEHLRDFKGRRELYDFNDFLLKFAEKETVPHFKALIIDEAQDLSLIQWDCMERLIERADVTHIAGDDDQAIFTWAGASIEKFRSFFKRKDFEKKELKQSFRVPRKMHTLAERIIVKDTDREPKTYLPADKEGIIQRAITLGGLMPKVTEQINENRDETWLVLASTNSTLSEATSEFKKAGIKYDSKTSTSMSLEKIQALDDYEKLLKGEKLRGDKVKNIYGYLKTNVKRGYKTGKKSPDDLGTYNLKDLKDKHGLLTEAPWDEAFLKLPDDEVQYIKGILDSGRKLTDPSQVRISTISSIKGAEADTVILFVDISWGEKHYGGAEAHRKFYVAVTRAKKTLILIDPKKYELSYGLNVRDLLESA